MSTIMRKSENFSDRIRTRIDKSRFRNWQIYILITVLLFFFLYKSGFTLVVNLAEYINNYTKSATFYGITPLNFLFSCLQGIILALVAGRLYQDGDNYHKFIGNQFDTKERAFISKVFIMTLLAIFISVIIPSIVKQHLDELLFFQLLGIVTLLGYISIHLDISNWNIKNEIPIIISCILIILTPINII